MSHKKESGTNALFHFEHFSQTDSLNPLNRFSLKQVTNGLQNYDFIKKWQTNSIKNGLRQMVLFLIITSYLTHNNRLRHLKTRECEKTFSQFIERRAKMVHFFIATYKFLDNAKSTLSVYSFPQITDCRTYNSNKIFFYKLLWRTDRQNIR